MVWCQEEPKNMGAWTFVEPYLEWVLAQVGGKSEARPLRRPSRLGGDGDRHDVASIWRSSRPSSTTLSRI